MRIRRVVIFTAFIAALLLIIGGNLNYQGEPILSTNSHSFVEPGDLSRHFSVFDSVQYGSYRLYNFLQNYPWVVRMSFAIVVLSFLVWAFVTSRILMDSFFDLKRERTYELFMEMYSDTLHEILNSEKSLTIPEIRRMLRLSDDYYVSSMRGVKLWLDIYLTDYFGKHRTINQENIITLVDALGMRDYFGNVLLNGTDFQKQNVLQITRLMTIPMGESYVARLVNHKNMALRKEARLFYMLNSYDDPYAIIGEGMTFSLWNRMEIHSIISECKEQGRPMPSFYAQLQQTGNSVNRAFLLQEMGYWGDDADMARILPYLNSPEDREVRATIKSLAYRRYTPAVPAIMAVYDQGTEHTCRLVMRALLQIHSGSIEDFYMKCYEISPAARTRLVALYCLHEYSDRGKKLFNRMKLTARAEETGLFEHVENEILLVTEEHVL